MMTAGAVLVVLGLIAIILSFVVAGWGPMLWVGVAIAAVGAVLVVIAALARRRPSIR